MGINGWNTTGNLMEVIITPVTQNTLKLQLQTGIVSSKLNISSTQILFIFAQKDSAYINF